MARRKNVKRIDPRYFLHENLEDLRSDVHELLSDVDMSPEDRKIFLARVKGAKSEDDLEDLESEIWERGT